MRDLSVELMRLYKLKKYTVWNAVNVLFNKTPEDPEKFKKVLLLSEMIIRNTLKTTDVKSREGRGYQWVLIEILCREGKFEEAEKEVEERMANYVMSQKLLDERVFQRTLLRELHREEEILPLMEEDIKSGRKLDWDAILFYVDSVCALLGDEAFPRLLLLLQTPAIEAALVFLSLSLFRLRSPSLFLLSLLLLFFHSLPFFFSSSLFLFSPSLLLLPPPLLLLSLRCHGSHHHGRRQLTLLLLFPLHSASRCTDLAQQRCHASSTRRHVLHLLLLRTTRNGRNGQWRRLHRWRANALLFGLAERCHGGKRRRGWLARWLRDRCFGRRTGLRWQVRYAAIDGIHTVLLLFVLDGNLEWRRDTRITREAERIISASDSVRTDE